MEEAANLFALSSSLKNSASAAKHEPEFSLVSVRAEYNRHDSDAAEPNQRLDRSGWSCKHAINMTRRFYTAASILALAAVYFCAGKFGLSLAVVNASSSAVWPPTGIALAVLLLWGYRLWPGIFLGAFLVNLTTQGTLLTSMGIATGNTLEALLGAWLVNLLANGRHAFDRALDIFKFILLAAIVSPTLSATFGATSLALGGFAQWNDFVPIWTTWWLGDAIGALIVAPLILIWGKPPLLRWNWRRLLEAAAIIGCVLLVSLIGFGSEVNNPLSRYIRFLLYPSTLWVAFRFGQHGAITAVFSVTCVAIWGTLRGFGPFVLADPNESLLFLQGYLGAFTVTNLILGALVSERQRAEEVLRESENRFRTLASHAPVGIFMSNPNGDSIYVNECWCSMTGLKPEQAQGREWIKAVHPDDRERILSGWNEAVTRSNSSNAEFRFLRPDGVVIWVYGNAIQLRNASDQLVGYIGTVVDITERKQAETALHQTKDELAKANEDLENRVLRRSAQLVQANTALQDEIAARKQAELVHTQLAAIVESSSDAILSKTLDGFITSWNKGAEKMFGHTANEIVGRSVATIIPADRSDELALMLESIQREEAVEPFETVRVRKDGRVVPVSLTLSPIKDEAGRVTGVSAIMQDISERKRLEAEILQVSEREQRRIAEDLHDGVGQQLGGISCLSDVLKKNLAEQASPEAEAAAKISRLLTVAMAQTRSLARGLHPVAPEANGLMSALEDLATRVSDLFKVSCHFACAQPVLIEDNTMATHLYRIAQEAVNNALKHGKAQQIVIGLSSTPERIILAVNDDGVGFKRSERRSKGLGLRIMNHRAAMIGGNFTVQKKAGGGTTAVCNVPMNSGPTPKNENG